MTTNMIIFLIIAWIATFASRCFIELGVFTYFSKKQYKRYKKDIGFWDRYFLITIKKTAHSQYIKSEKRRINYKLIFNVYFYTHICLIASLLANTIICTLVELALMDTQIAVITLTADLFFVLISFFVYALLEGYEHKEYHRKRH